MAKSFLVSPGRAYLVIAGEGTKIVRANGTLIDTVPEGANNVSITVDTHEIIVMDNAAKIQQLYNGNSGSSGIMTIADGEDAGSWKIEIVSSLPEQGSAGIIYMLRTNRTGTDRYDDYIWIPEDNAYELLGRRPESTPVDLSNVAKTDVANTFTKSQQINGTLTATTVNVANLSCDQSADIGTATVNDLDYNTASGSSMTVSHVTILTSLHVAPQAAVDLPGVAWGTGTGGDYISVTRKTLANTVEISSTATVGNLLTLGTGSIRLEGPQRRLSVIGDPDDSVVIEPSCIHVLSSDVELALTGGAIRALSRTENRTLFSFAQDADEKLVLTANAGIILNGTVSMPGTLTVNNLNVTGTVTGITSGGGTPTVDFSNGVTVMQTLTADDVVADTVTASTLSADSSVSVDSESVIYRHSDGAMYVQGDVVNATRVVATIFLPTNIQGATFTGPLVMTPDNAIRVLSQGGAAEIRNGNLTGFSYAQIGQCSIMQSLTADKSQARSVTITDTLVVKDLVVTGTTADIPSLTMEEGTARSVTITDTLVVKDLVVTGTTTGIQGGDDTPPEFPGVVDGNLQVSGVVTAASVSADSVSTDRISMNGTGALSVMSSLDVAEALTVRGSLFAKGTVSAVDVLANFVEADSLKVVVPSTTDSLAAIYEMRSDSNAEMLELVAYNKTSSQSTRMATLRVSTLCVSSITGPDDISALSVMSPLCAWQGVTVMNALTVGDSLKVGSLHSYMYVDPVGNVQVNTLSVIHTIRASEVDADSIVVSNLVVEDTLSAPVKDVQTTQAGTADTLCRWAQIGSSHNMLSIGRLMYIDIPGPSVQKLPVETSGTTSFVLSLWYQADSAGTDYRLIGSSANAVTPVAGTTTSNKWNFSDVEITDAYLGHNLRLLMLPSHDVPSTWTEAAAASQASTSYIQGRYSNVSTDNDCALSASDTGNVMYRSILTAEFSCVAYTPGYLITEEQKELLDWLAANQEALSNLISSASA